MDGWVDGWMDGWMYGCMDVWMYGCMDGWMDGWSGSSKTAFFWNVLPSVERYSNRDLGYHLFKGFWKIYLTERGSDSARESEQENECACASVCACSPFHVARS